MVRVMRFPDMANMQFAQFNSWDISKTQAMGSYDMYQDPYSMRWNTSHQDKRIRELEEELTEKKRKKEKDVKNLIAYYYRR